VLAVVDAWDVQLMCVYGSGSQEGQVVAAILEQLHLLVSTMVCGGEKDEML